MQPRKKLRLSPDSTGLLEESRLNKPNIVKNSKSFDDFNIRPKGTQFLQTNSKNNIDIKGGKTGD